MLRKRLAFGMAIGSIALIGCSDGDGSSDGSAGSTGGNTSSIELELNNLEPLGDGFDYEGWIIVDGSPVSTGTFDVVDGTTTYTFDVDSADAMKAEMFVLSIEPSPDSDPAPADTKILGGPFASGVASLSIDHMAALGNDFSGAAGEYILATPTTASDDTDETQGIWWLVPPSAMGAMPTAGLTLPDLPAGWVYEGWVASSDTGPVTTGRFSAVDMADDDGAGTTAGSDGAPPFPGQDFITPARALADGMTAAVISVEPEPDNAPEPFSLKPLVHGTIADVTAPTTQTMENMSANNPTGTATIQ